MLDNRSSINKRFRTKKENTTHLKKYKCPECDKNYLSFQALYTHKKQKHAYIYLNKKNMNECSIQTIDNFNFQIDKEVTEKIVVNTFESKLDSTKFLYHVKEIENSSKKEEKTINRLKDVLLSEINLIFFSNNKLFEKFIKSNLKLTHHHALYREYELFMENEDEYKHNDSKIFVADKLLFLYLIESYRMNPEPAFIDRIVFYAILLREFVNKEKQKELNLHSLLDFTSINYIDEVIYLSNAYLTFVQKMEEEDITYPKKFNLEEGINFIKDFARWLYLNEFTQLKLS